VQRQDKYNIYLVFAPHK